MWSSSSAELVKFQCRVGKVVAGIHTQVDG